MTNLPLLAAIAGGLLAAGLVVIVAGIRGIPLFAETAPTSRHGRWLRDRNVQVRLGVALAVGLGALLVLGWPVAALLAGAATFFLPTLLSGRAAQRRAARLSGLESWVRQLADGLSGSAGLREVILSSAEHPPTALAVEVSDLAARIRLGIPMDEALRMCAEDIGEEYGDVAIIALTFADEAGGPGLRRILTELAANIARSVETELRIDAERASHRVTARVIIGALVVFATFAMLNRAYVAPFGTPLGQFVLGGIGVLWATAIRWLHRLANPTITFRLLADQGERR